MKFDERGGCCWSRCCWSVESSVFEVDGGANNKWFSRALFIHNAIGAIECMQARPGAAQAHETTYAVSHDYLQSRYTAIHGLVHYAMGRQILIPNRASWVVF